MKKVYTKKDIKKDAKGEENIVSKKKRLYKVPVILIVVWVSIIILFGYSLWVSKTNNNSNILFEETTISPSDEVNTNTSAIANMTKEQRTQAQIRDSLRLADMKKLRSALESYKEDNEHYPEVLDNLTPDYLKEIPVNPSPGGQEYVYTGIGSKPYSYYDLSYVLEVGAEGISPGMHIASPGGIATP